MQVQQLETVHGTLNNYILKMLSKFISNYTFLARDVIYTSRA